MSIPRPQRESIVSLLHAGDIRPVASSLKAAGLLVTNGDGGAARATIGGISKGDEVFHVFGDTEVTVLLSDPISSSGFDKPAEEGEVVVAPGLYVLDEQNTDPDRHYERRVVALSLHHTSDRAVVFQRVGKPVEYSPVL